MGLAHTDLLGAQFAGYVVLDGGLDGEDQIIGTRLVIVQGGHAQSRILLDIDTGFLHLGALHSGDVAVLKLTVGSKLAGQIVLDELIDFFVHILHLHGVDNRLTGTRQTHTVVAEKLGPQQGHHSQDQNHSDQVDDIDLAEELAFIINDTHK